MSATAIQPIIRPQASIVEVHDGDTFLFLLDLHGRGLEENGCETEWVRLRDFSARELSDTAPTDPLSLGRVTGPAAKEIAATILAAAHQIIVEILGPDSDNASVSTQSFGRYVGWVWVDGQSLGDLLQAQHAVAAGKFEGDPQADGQ